MGSGTYQNCIAYVFKDYITTIFKLALYSIDTVAGSASLLGTSLDIKKVYSIEAVENSIFYITFEMNTQSQTGFAVYEIDTASGNLVFQRFQENEFRETGFKFHTNFHQDFFRFYPELATIVGLSSAGDVLIQRYTDLLCYKTPGFGSCETCSSSLDSSKCLSCKVTERLEEDSTCVEKVPLRVTRVDTFSDEARIEIQFD